MTTDILAAVAPLKQAIADKIENEVTPYFVILRAMEAYIASGEPVTDLTLALGTLLDDRCPGSDVAKAAATLHYVAAKAAGTL